MAVDQIAFLDQVWDDSAYIDDLNRDVESTMIEFKDLIEQQCREEEEAWSALDDLQRALGFGHDTPFISDEQAAWEPNPDEPLTVAQVVCLPELGGRLFVDGTGIESKNVRPYAVRNAIAEGRLKLHPASRRGSHLLSRNRVKEWMAWQDVANPLDSNSKLNVKTKTAASKPRSGSSNILTREREKQLSSAQASALEKLRMRRSTSQNG